MDGQTVMEVEIDIQILHSQFKITLEHGLLYTRTEDSRPFFSKSEPAGISKNGSNIICKSLKSKHFLFYAQGCGAKIKPAIPF